MLGFVLVTLRETKPAKLSSIRRFSIMTDLKSPKIRFCTTRPGDVKWFFFVLVKST